MAACAALCALEAVHPDSPLLTAGRICAVFLQGAWFVGAGFIMYDRESFIGLRSWMTGRMGVPYVRM